MQIRLLPVSGMLAFTVSTLALTISSPVLAQTWTGSHGSDWYDDSNWSTGHAPTNATTAIIVGGVVNTPTIDGGTAAASVLHLGFPTVDGGAALELINQAHLTTATTTVGQNSVNNHGNLLELQSGTLSLSGNSSMTTDFFNIGLYGAGIVNITDASKVTVNSGLSLGQHYNDVTGRFATGNLTISGSGSELISLGTTTIGAGDALDGGQGTVLIENGGKLKTNSATLGKAPLSSGTVTVTGDSSRWDVTTTNTTTVGDAGTGKLSILDGGAFSSAGWIVLGGHGGSGEVSISGAGSNFSAGQIRVGGSGPGTNGSGTFSASAGATVNASHFMVGNAVIGTGTATISGANTVVSASDYVMIGWNGEGAVTLSKSAMLKSPLAYLAYSAGSKGTLNIGAASGSAATSAGTFDGAEIRFGAGTGILLFNHNDPALEFSPMLTGSGTVRHLAGTTNYSGNGAGFTGSTIIDGGRLNLQQALGGTVTVNNMGTLGGTGTIGATTVNNGGSIDIGGKLSVNGDLAFNSRSQYIVEVDGGGSGEIVATGTVTIADADFLVRPLGMQSDQEKYRILSGSVLADTFTGIASTSAFVDVSLDYSKANEIWLDLKRNDIKFEQVASNANQQGVGKVLTNLPLDNPLVVAMTGLSAAEAQQAMDELSGDSNSTVSTVGSQVAGQVQGVVMNRIRQTYSTLGSGNGAVSSYWPGGSDVAMTGGMPASVWLQGLGEYTHIRPNATAGGMDAGTGGILGGADIQLDDWRIGAVAGYTGTAFNAIGRSANGNVQNLHAGIYAGAELDAVRLQFNALQTWHGVSSVRNVSVGPLTETLTAEYGARTSLLFGEFGYALDLGGTSVEPFASASYALTHTDAYAETGGAAALTSAAARNEAVTTVIGLRSSASMAMGDKLVTLNGMLGWQHQSGDAPSSQFSLAGSTAFTVVGANTASNALVYEAGINLDLSEKFNFDLTYSGRLSPDDMSHGIKGIVAASF